MLAQIKERVSGADKKELRSLNVHNLCILNCILLT